MVTETRRSTGSRPSAAARRPVIPIEAAPPKAPPGISLRWLLVAPHRLFFFLGMLGVAIVSLWWLAQLAARTAGAPLALALPPTWTHAWTMLNAFVPFFMFGFLFTAGPKWLNVAPPAMRELAPAGVAAFFGVLFVLASAHMSATLVAAGALLAFIAWGVLLLRFARLIRVSSMTDQTHARLVLTFFSFGTLSHLAFALGALQLSAVWVHSAQMLSIWLFIAPVYVTVGHRLIPFFTASVVPFLDAWRPLWLLWAFIGIVIGHGLLPLATVASPSALLAALRLAVDLSAAVLFGFVAWRWGVVQSLRNRLLAMLHLGFVWLGLAFLLYAWNGGAVLLDAPEAAIGLAPLHALTMGFFGSVMFAMVTRVTAGHSGRALVADNLTWSLFWILQIAVLLRILSETWLAQGGTLTLAAIVLWCAAFVVWAGRSTPIYLRPRPDGRPG